MKFELPGIDCVVVINPLQWTRVTSGATKGTAEIWQGPDDSIVVLGNAAAVGERLISEQLYLAYRTGTAK